MAKVFEVEDNEKSIKIAHQHGKTEKKVTEADQSGIIEDVCEMGHGEHKQVEIQKPKEVDRQTPNEVQLTMGLRENDMRKDGTARTDETRSLCLFNKVGFTKQKRKESIASNYIESAV